MNTRFSRWLIAMLLIVAASPMFVQAQLRDPVTDLNEARRVFVPVEDLDVIIERDKQGVLLPRAKFDVLLTQAKANAEKNAVPAGISVVLTSADYAAQIVGDQLLISVTAELTQFDDLCLRTHGVNILLNYNSRPNSMHWEAIKLPPSRYFELPAVR